MRDAPKSVVLALLITAACKPQIPAQVAAADADAVKINPQDWIDSYQQHVKDPAFISQLSQLRQGSVANLLNVAFDKAASGAFSINGVNVGDIRTQLRLNRNQLEALDTDYKSLGDLLDQNSGTGLAINADNLQQAVNLMQQYNQRSGVFSGSTSLGLTSACAKDSGATSGCGAGAGVGVGGIALGAALCATGVGCAVGGWLIAGGAGMFAAGGTCAAVSHGLSVASCNPSKANDASRLAAGDADLKSATTAADGIHLPAAAAAAAAAASATAASAAAPAAAQ